jgi:hypothetical protein
MFRPRALLFAIAGPALAFVLVVVGLLAGDAESAAVTARAVASLR